MKIEYQGDNIAQIDPLTTRALLYPSHSSISSFQYMCDGRMVQLAVAPMIIEKQ